MTDISDTKAQARKAAFLARKSAHSVQASRAGCVNLIDFLADHRGKPLAGYMPIRTEIDILPAMEHLSKDSEIGVPVIRGAGQPLDFHRWTPGCKMTDGPFGARIPEMQIEVTPQVVILPLVAFDRRGFRLGYGGGFYDRTLELLRAAGPVLAVGFAYGAQELACVPTEPTDQPLDAMVTDKEIIRFPPPASTAR